jgi:hypothetical protein
VRGRQATARGAAARNWAGADGGVSHSVIWRRASAPTQGNLDVCQVTGCGSADELKPSQQAGPKVEMIEPGDTASQPSRPGPAWFVSGGLLFLFFSLLFSDTGPREPLGKESKEGHTEKRCVEELPMGGSAYQLRAGLGCVSLYGSASGVVL